MHRFSTAGFFTLPRLFASTKHKWHDSERRMSEAVRSSVPWVNVAHVNMPTILGASRESRTLSNLVHLVNEDTQIGFSLFVV